MTVLLFWYSARIAQSSPDKWLALVIWTTTPWLSCPSDKTIVLIKLLLGRCYLPWKNHDLTLEYVYGKIANLGPLFCVNFTKDIRAVLSVSRTVPLPYCCNIPLKVSVMKEWAWFMARQDVFKGHMDVLFPTEFHMERKLQGVTIIWNVCCSFTRYCCTGLVAFTQLRAAVLFLYQYRYVVVVTGWCCLTCMVLYVKSVHKVHSVSMLHVP